MTDPSPPEQADPDRGLVFRHLGCHAAVCFDLSGGFCTGCGAEGLTAQDYYGPAGPRQRVLGDLADLVAALDAAQTVASSWCSIVREEAEHRIGAGRAGDPLVLEQVVMDPVYGQALDLWDLVRTTRRWAEAVRAGHAIPDQLQEAAFRYRMQSAIAGPSAPSTTGEVNPS